MGRPTWLTILAGIGLLLSAAPACDHGPVAPRPSSDDTGADEESPLGRSEYPRRAFCHAFFAAQPDSLLWQYDLLYGHSATHDVLALKARAAAAGQHDWLARVTIVQVFCPLTTRFRWMEQGLPRYVEDHWRENPDYAIDKAVYENFRLGCNWFLCDTDSKALPLWGDEHHMLNLSDACPRGRWGSTAGLTFVEWMCSDAFRDIFLGTRWRDAFDGLEVEDGPPRCGVPCWRWEREGAFIDPDGPACDSLPPETCARFQERTRPPFDRWLRGCIGQLTRQGILTRCNGHWTGLHPEKQNYPLIGECFSSCKLEKFGDWSGWPYDDIREWARVYFAVEQAYAAAEDTGGWLGATCQITPERGWPLERIYRWERCLAALCLMGEATFSLSWREDPLLWNLSEPVPEAPELQIALGEPLGPAQRWERGWFRWFAHGEESWTVVSDMTAEDGLWLRGQQLPDDRLH